MKRGVTAAYWRQASPNANALIAATLRNLGGGKFFKRLEIAERDWVDGDIVKQLWQRHEQRPEPAIEVWQLWAIAAIELWSIHAARSASLSPGATIGVA